ncbi:MAG: HAMP domain-containing histidine kinase [Lewinellaceae bacterium]|nr:HAMP domain-containing histidine kinase [Lewinellaceae bacterium]
MKINHIAWLIGASALAILALIGFQIIWMQHSRKLLEEQFNNRVNMALCSTVERLASDPEQSNDLRACCLPGKNEAAGNQNFDALLQQPEMQTALTAALHFYQIDLPYQFSIAPNDSAGAETAARYSCSLGPILENDSHHLQLEFEGKTEYFLQRMGLMVFASVAILLLICAIFGIGVYYLLRQKRLSDHNRDFFNLMTHEFRTPLTNIRLAGNMLARKETALADNQYLNIIRRECNHLSEQVENVLHLGGLEKGEYQLKKQPVDLRQLANEVVSDMDIQIREYGAEVNVHTGGSANTIEGDPLHLGNAFRNILDNALKYGNTNPVVHIGIEPQANGLRVSFADNGIGLTAKERRSIFKKFHRCDNALRTGQKGFGLGLAYVKKIVELHQGRIAVSSADGHGARFELFFPASK